MANENRQRRLAALRDLAPDLPGRRVDEFGEYLASLRGWDAVRLNPYMMAEARGWRIDSTIDLCVAAVRAGLLEFEWNLICRYCAGIIEHVNHIHGLNGHVFRCGPCDADTPADLDHMVEVAFNVVPELREGTLDPYASDGDYAAAFTSKNVIIPPALAGLVQSIRKALILARPGARATVQVTFDAEARFRVFSRERNLGLALPVSAGAATGPVRITLERGGFRCEPAQVPLGPATLEITNTLDVPAGIGINRIDEATLRLMGSGAPFRRFLRASVLLCNQRYRDLFRFQGARTDLRLNVRSLTFLFTDLKGSTALYEEVGDLEAYRLVHAHFGALRSAVKEHGGAIVKTMGDAIMATFPDTIEAVQSAETMVRSIQHLNKNGAEGTLGLKVGVHEGPALVIEADGALDYFGQTVNTAARVQAQAGADEICFSESVLGAPGVRDWLTERRYASSKERVSLKGIGEPVLMHRLALEES